MRCFVAFLIVTLRILFQFSIGDARYLCSGPDAFCGLTFQFSIGDAGQAGGGVSPVAENTVSILYWRCVATAVRHAPLLPRFNSLLEMHPNARYEHGMTPLHYGFNSLLEMRVRCLRRDCPARHAVVFQFSIGDAQARHYVPVGVTRHSWFQFSIGDAGSEEARGAVQHLCRVSILYWRCRSPPLPPPLRRPRRRFQFSIGDAGGGLRGLSRIAVEGFNSLLEMQRLHHPLHLRWRGV